MSSYPTILLTLSSLLTITTIIPTSSFTDPFGGLHIVFPSTGPTCGADSSMAPFASAIAPKPNCDTAIDPTCGNDPAFAAPPAATVNTQPDCDTAIDIICHAAQADQHIGTSNLGHTTGTCEGHIIFANGHAQIPYADCVQNFQSITETCMLIGGPKNQAVAGKQFGARSVQYYPEARTEHPDGTVPVWAANNGSPRYLMGPPGVFGTDFGAMDANDILTGH